jgi:hypothetical protein
MMHSGITNVALVGLNEAAEQLKLHHRSDNRHSRNHGANRHLPAGGQAVPEKNTGLTVGTVRKSTLVVYIIGIGCGWVCRGSFGHDVSPGYFSGAQNSDVGQLTAIAVVRIRASDESIPQNQLATSGKFKPNRASEGERKIPHVGRTPQEGHFGWTPDPKRELLLPAWGYPPEGVRSLANPVGWSSTVKVCGGPNANGREDVSNESVVKGGLRIVRVFVFSATGSSFLHSCSLFGHSRKIEYHLFNLGLPELMLHDLVGLRDWLKYAPWNFVLNKHMNTPNVFVFNGMYLPSTMLEMLPLQSVLLITCDELNQFGFSHPVIKVQENGSMQPHVRRRVAHGPKSENGKRGSGNLLWASDGVNVSSHLNRLFSKNPTGEFARCEMLGECPNVIKRVERLVFPDGMRPIFKMYYSERHEKSFPSGQFQDFPLGPRTEFQRPPATRAPGESRGILLNFVGSPTSLSRVALAAELENATANGSLPRDRTLVHVSSRWSSQLSEDSKDQHDHFAPSQYAKVLANSTFTLCPQVSDDVPLTSFALLSLVSN